MEGAWRKTSTETACCRIELLDTEWLERERESVRLFRDQARRLGIDLGWHYLLDLAWITHHLGDPANKTILDAGAGTGVLQWWLADQGAVVISADRLDRRQMSPRFRQIYRMEGMVANDLRPLMAIASDRLHDRTLGLGRRFAGAARAFGGALLETTWPKRGGVVVVYRTDLDGLHQLADGSVDAVVSVSALEHNEPDRIGATVDELWRVLRPGGIMLVTVSAAKASDWFHEPSAGWCFTEPSLRKHFRLPEECPSNFRIYDQSFARLVASDDLRRWLSPFYSRSGDNGMPWGIWDPKYHPVGVLRIKED